MCLEDRASEGVMFLLGVRADLREWSFKVVIGWHQWTSLKSVVSPYILKVSTSKMYVFDHEIGPARSDEDGKNHVSSRDLNSEISHSLGETCFINSFLHCIPSSIAMSNLDND